MVDHVIVTVKTADGRVIGDFEMPALLEGEKLKKLLLTALKAKLPDRFLGATGLRLMANGRPIANDSTLSDNGVWDGSTVTVSVEGA